MGLYGLCSYQPLTAAPITLSALTNPEVWQPHKWVVFVQLGTTRRWGVGYGLQSPEGVTEEFICHCAQRGELRRGLSFNSSHDEATCNEGEESPRARVHGWTLGNSRLAGKKLWVAFWFWIKGAKGIKRSFLQNKSKTGKTAGKCAT